MNRRERLNEDQNQFFGFSPMALGDEVYNGLIESWERQVDGLLETPQWSRVKGDKKARAALFNLMFHKGNGQALEAVCDHIAEYAHLHVFKIPDNVVLPGTEPLQKMDSVDLNALRRKVAAAENRVEEAKRRRALLQHELKDVTERVKVIGAIARQLGYVNPESTMRTDDADESSLLDDSVFYDENNENDAGDRSTVGVTTEDTVASQKGAESEDVAAGDETLTGESVEEMMERSMSMEE